MPDIDDLNDSILESATTNVKNAVVDGNSVTAHSIDDQIKAANHVAGQTAASTGKFGLRFSQLIPPGCG